MKKIIELLLAAVMLVGLVACASKTTDTPKEETTMNPPKLQRRKKLQLRKNPLLKRKLPRPPKSVL